jgi:hypothetical protein
MKISLFASSVRPQLYESFFKSLENENLKYETEVIFAGHLTKEEIEPCLKLNQRFEYVHTDRIKPSQCYEVARRSCTGEVVVWVADDCEFKGGILSKAYEHWKAQDNEKLILSIQTKESGYNLPIGQFFNMKNHCFFGFKPETPLMAPLAMMSRKYLDKLGGLDKRYCCGQYENDIVMRVMVDGGKVEIFGDKESYIDIDHLGKSISIGESKVEGDFLKRPFARGYHVDRQILEGSWVKDGNVTMERNDEFQPYDDKDLLTVSQSNRGDWI